MGLISLLAVVSAIGKARKGEWYAAGGVLLSTLGFDLMALSAMDTVVPLFVLGLAVTLIGFLLEFLAYRARSAAAKAPAGTSP